MTKVSCRTFSPSRRTHSGRTSAFTLVELLCVLACIGALSALLGPTLSSLGGSQLTRDAVSISGQFDQARTYAMSRSTYVWVGIVDGDGSTSDRRELLVFTVSSRDGTDVLSEANLIPLGRVATYKSSSLADISQLDFASRKRDDSVTQVATLAASQPVVKFPAPYAKYSPGQANTRVIQISPSGEFQIRHSQSDEWLPARRLEVGLQRATDSGTVRLPQCASVQIVGITGQTQVFRP